MALLKVSTARNIQFKMIDSADHLSKKTGAAPVVQISKDNGAFGAAAGTVTELSNGWYNLAATTVDTNTKGDLAFFVTGTGADDTDWKDQVVTDLPGDSVASVTGAVGSVTGGVTVTTNNDKTGYVLTQAFPANFAALSISAGGLVDILQTAADKVWGSASRLLTAGTNIVLAKGTGITGFNDITAAAAATGVWQDATAGDFTVAGSIGKSLFTSGNAPGAASGIALVGSNMGTATSVTGSVGSVTGAVGSVTGNVGGNVTGSVGSVVATVAANLTQILGTALTETAGQLAGGFKKFFNIATPAATMDHGVLVDTVTTVTNDVGITQAGADKVWSTTVRAITDKAGFALSSAANLAIWQVQTSLMSGAGEVGKRIVDFLTGDSFARLGAPAGASHAADIAAVQTTATAVKAQTDKLTFNASNHTLSDMRKVNNTTVNGDGAATPWGP